MVYGLSFNVRLLGHMASLTFEPFGNWKLFSLAVPNGKSVMSPGWHFYFGPVHFWGFPIGHRGIIGFEIELVRQLFRGSKMQLPHGMRQIFGNIPTGEQP